MPKTIEVKYADIGPMPEDDDADVYAHLHGEDDAVTLHLDEGMRQAVIDGLRDAGGDA